MIELLLIALPVRAPPRLSVFEDNKSFAFEEAQIFLEEILELNEGLPTKTLAWEYVKLELDKHSLIGKLRSSHLVCFPTDKFCSIE
jgi:hypothetical protein